MAEPRGLAPSRDDFRSGVFDVCARCDDRLDYHDALIARSITRDAATGSSPIGSGLRPPSIGVPTRSPEGDICVLHASLRAEETRLGRRVTGIEIARRERMMVAENVLR